MSNGWYSTGLSLQPVWRTSAPADTNTLINPHGPQSKSVQFLQQVTAHAQNYRLSKEYQYLLYGDKEAHCVWKLCNSLLQCLSNKYGLNHILAQQGTNIMPVPRCAWGVCNSDGRYKHKDYTKNVSFFTFPKPNLSDSADPKKSAMPSVD